MLHKRPRAKLRAGPPPREPGERRGDLPPAPARPLRLFACATPRWLSLACFRAAGVLSASFSVPNGGVSSCGTVVVGGTCNFGLHSFSSLLDLIWVEQVAILGTLLERP